MRLLQNRFTPTTFCIGFLESPLEVGSILHRISRRWSWDTSGKPLSFENTAAYEHRRITDRLTPTIVSDYARALGVDVFNDAYYANLGCLVTNENIDPSRCRTETFAEAQSNRGFGVDA